MTEFMTIFAITVVKLGVFLGTIGALTAGTFFVAEVIENRFGDAWSRAFVVSVFLIGFSLLISAGIYTEGGD